MENEFWNLVGMCPELESLFLTLKKQDLDYSQTLAPLVIEKAKAPGFNLREMVDWASELIQAYGLKKDEEKRSLDGLSLEYLTYIGLGNCPITKPKWLFPKIHNGHFRKRPTSINLKGKPKIYLRLLDQEAFEGLNPDVTEVDMIHGGSNYPIRIEELEEVQPTCEPRRQIFEQKDLHGACD